LLFVAGMLFGKAFLPAFFTRYLAADRIFIEQPLGGAAIFLLNRFLDGDISTDHNTDQKRDGKRSQFDRFGFCECIHV